MSDKCEEIEKLKKAYDSFNLHKNVCEIVGPKHKKTYCSIEARRWEYYYASGE